MRRSAAAKPARRAPVRSRAGARRRRLGQHFLADARACERIVEAFAPGPEDVVLEIGPGRGALTDRLAGRVGSLVAVEIDPTLAALLSRRYAGRAGVRVVRADALELLRCGLPALAAECGLTEAGRMRLIGNLPYSIATPLVREIALAFASLSDAVVMVQKEVADRILAGPGGAEYGLLTLLVGLRAEARRLFDLPPGAFRPPPKVHSSVIALRMPSRPTHDAATLQAVERLAAEAFSRRRKTILNALSGLGPLAGPAPARRSARAAAAADAELEAALREAGIAPSDRPERVPPAGWIALARALLSRARA